MGSSSIRRCNDDSFFTSERPHFFKVILKETLETGMLEIPKKFVRRHGCSLPNSVLLGLPNGAVWQIGASKNNYGVWLDDGWKEFEEFYSLRNGHLLIFEHEGGSKFQVLIFDNSGMEIRYPDCSTGFNEECERSSDEDSIEILDDFDTSQRSRGRAPLKSPHAQFSGPELRTSRCRCEKLERAGAGTSAAGKAKLKAFVEKKPALTYEEKVVVLRRASSFRSENPYFMVVMQPRYTDRKCELGLPVDFARRHLGFKLSDAVLCVSDGRVWPARYHYYSKLAKPKATICYGWKGFANDHNIKVGDLCVFELIKTSPIWFKVFIYRDDGSTS